MKNRVGLGTFPLADVFSHISKDGAKDIVRQFLDKGGYYIDTAPMYGFGDVEDLLGEVLQEFSREQFYITSKCGFTDFEGRSFKTMRKSGKYEDVIRECDRSLKRMKLDYIDLYFEHNPDPNTPVEETMRALLHLQKEEKIKEIGVSNVNIAELKEYCLYGKISFVQNRFSLLNQSIQGELREFMMKHEIKLVPYQVIDRGQLTGKVFENIATLRKEDLRNNATDWAPDKLNIVADWVKSSLSPIATNLGVTLEQLSIAWALHQPFMGFVIVGNTTPTYTEINLKANEIKLDHNTLDEIDQAYKKLEQDIQEQFRMSIREFRGLNEKFY